MTIYRTTYRTERGRTVSTTWTNPGCPPPTPADHAINAEYYSQLHGEPIEWITEAVPDADMPWPTNPARLKENAS